MTEFNEVLQPIICDAYEEPGWHWVIERGRPPIKTKGRRDAHYYYRPAGRSTDAGHADEIGTRVPLERVNDLRERVRAWRGDGYRGVTGVTANLLAYWQSEGRYRRLFFCQREAIETVIFLVEAREDFRQGVTVPLDEPGQFLRYACKMATGTGKTTVMAALAAWSILNKVADRGDRRFSEVVLVVCPNVTIRDRLEELYPQRGEGSLYRTRDLVPADLMSDLRKGTVVLTNWHTLAPQEKNQVGGVGARVIQRGVESDTAIVSRVLKEAGGKGNVLVLNDEAHHAYRIRQQGDDAEEPDDDELAEVDRREATVWIEGLDRIQRVRGINFCVDLSATPFYLTRSGSDAGRSFPWIVSDFGLIDAIESGLVKIPQLPVQDTTGDEIPAYFNVWKWIVEKKLSSGEKGGRRGQVKPEAVLQYAQQPIAQLAGLWRQEFDRWQEDIRQGRRPPVPPVFIVVCRDTRLAKLIYEWLTGEASGAPPPVEEFRNAKGREHTVRVDSRVVEDLATDAPRNDESRRLRFVLSTIGKTEWPDRQPPSEWLDLVEKLNRRAAEEGGVPIDPKVPPGRDVRCIVSVAMLTEGWDATTVTHIVGLRPFQSQLLCEQVVGRGLRRSQYHDLTVEEVAKVYGVPFELIPLKAAPGTPTPPPKVHHVRAMTPERDALEIRYPRVEGYFHRPSTRIEVNWSRVPRMTLDPMEMPDEVRTKGLSSERGGRLSLFGPGALGEASFEPWRESHRLQELQFDLARHLTERHVGHFGDVPAQALFPQMLAIVRRFVDEKVHPAGRRHKKDVFLEPYFTWATESLLDALTPADDDAPELPRYEAHRGAGSSREVDFWTSRAVWETTRSHLNYVVADTLKWEQSAAFYLDTDERVVAYVKNANLGFAIPYTFRGVAREYLPDFLVRLRHEDREIGTLILETKGYDPAELSKVDGAHRWVAAVNADGTYGRWAYRIVTSPNDVPRVIASAVLELTAVPRPGWRAALRRFVTDVRSLYGHELDSVVLYGSRARGDAAHDSDIDTLVVLKTCSDVHVELKRIAPIASRVSSEFDVVLSALPADAREYREAGTPFMLNVRREGTPVT